MDFFRAFYFQRKQAIILLLFMALAFTLYGGFHYMSHLSTKQVALIRGNPEEKQLAFTFNISWGEDKVYDILKTLKKHDVRATFFVSGEWAERHPQIIDDIIEQEHELGMMGYRYKNYLDQEIEQVRKDILYAQNLFEKLGYKKIRYIRPPSGLFNEEVITLAQSLGLDVVHWSITSKDWENPGVENIVAEVKKASNGDIVLLHASDVAKQTAPALDLIIEHFNKSKFNYVTISQLKDGVIADESLIE
ncbi:MAG TPA: polysaccharide deacetylase family protein [Pseudogracilibacillus sp.]|nr:polysaccharide deacetylase family protein [Pseudogracilibacillus sp.]